MADLKDTIKTFSDEYLLELYHNRGEEYTQDAVQMMEAEIALRNIGKEEDNSAVKKDEIVLDLANAEFVPFDHSFYQTDLLFAQAILRDEKIPCIVDSGNWGDVLPVESEASQSFTIHVPQIMLEKAHQLIDEHFIRSEGYYQLRYSEVKDRLTLLSFNEIPLSQKQLEEEVEVQFTAQEKTALIPYLNKLLQQADELEEKTQRVVFYYDNIEECLSHITRNNREQFSRMDLLTILEVLQIYCDDTDFPEYLLRTAEALLTFFND
jgi:hypothetical protein